MTSLKLYQEAMGLAEEGCAAHKVRVRMVVMMFGGWKWGLGG